ncbi:MAG: hypothetical protein AAF404_10085 [Pseudomonadota bacterium]
MTDVCMRIRIVLSLFLLFSTAITAGCNPGGGIGGTGKQVTSDGVVIGVVDGFGSVIINDTRYETDLAAVLIDGNAGLLTDLKIGMKVRARISTRDKRADEIHYQPNVSGPVSFADPDTNTFEIFGQAIQVTDETVLDELTPVLQDLQQLRLTGAFWSESVLVTGEQIVFSEVKEKPVSYQRFHDLAWDRCEAHWSVVARVLPIPFLDYGNHCP